MTLPFVKKLVLVLLVGVSMLALTACGSSYADQFNTRIDNFNQALTTFNNQVDAVNQDNSQFSNADWQSALKQSLADLNASAGVLAGTDPSDVPSEYSNVDAIAKQIPVHTEKLLTIYNQAIDQQDISMISEANAHVDTITSLIGQINDELKKINGQ